MRAATMTIRRRIVAVVALASAPAAMVPAALVRLKAMTATTNKGLNKIKPILTPGAGVVTTRFQTNYIVTEYGAVNLRGKDLAQRAKLLISIAAPQFREEVDREAARRFGHSYLRLK